MRSLPERGAPSHRQCPPICPPQALLQLVQEKSFGEERGAIPPKRGGPIRSLLGRGWQKEGRWEINTRPSPVSLYLPSTGPFTACSGETLWRGKRGDSAQKEGPTRSLLGRGCGKRSFAEGRCVAFPYRSPFPHGHTGEGRPPTILGKGCAAFGRLSV